MEFVCVSLYLGLFVLMPIVWCYRATAADKSPYPGTLVKYFAAYFGGIVAAAGLTIVVGLLLPWPDGPPDQQAAHLMGLGTILFPILSLVCGGIALSALKRHRHRSSDRETEY